MLNCALTLGDQQTAMYTRLPQGSAKKLTIIIIKIIIIVK